MVLLLFQHAYIPISMWKATISLRVSWFPSGFCFLTWFSLHFIFGIYNRWICWHPHIPVIASATECYQPAMGISGELCVSSSSFISPGYIQLPGRMCNRSIHVYSVTRHEPAIISQMINIQTSPLYPNTVLKRKVPSEVKIRLGKKLLHNPRQPPQDIKSLWPLLASTP